MHNDFNDNAHINSLPDTPTPTDMPASAGNASLHKNSSPDDNPASSAPSAPPDSTTPVIAIDDLHISFDNRPVLSGVNLQVHKGENVVVLGRSGSGKSVLIKIIAGLLKPDSGRVQVLGQEIHTLKHKQLQALRLRIGFSFQGSALYDGMSVRENLSFPLIRNRHNISRQELQQSVHEVLDDVGLLETIDQMPAELSGGQKKRIGIARMLILRPDIILYDEPTGGLDPVTCVEINRLIRKVQQRYGTSSITITHDLSCARSTGDKIAMLHEGIILQQGSFDQVFNTEDPRIRAFYNYNFILDPHEHHTT